MGVLTRAGVLVAALTVLLAGWPTAADAATDQITVVVDRETESTGTVFIEGFIQFVEIRGDNDKVVGPKRLSSEAPVRFTLEPGAYNLISYTRACVASCPPTEKEKEQKKQETDEGEEPPVFLGGFDPPADYCDTGGFTRRSFEATVVVRPGKPCFIETDAGTSQKRLPRTGGSPLGGTPAGLVLVMAGALGLGRLRGRPTATH